MSYTIQDMADRVGRFTPAERLDLVEAFAELSKANGSQREVLTARMTPEAALVDIGASAVRELNACRQVIAEVVAGWDDVAKREGTSAITGVPGSERLRELLAANA